MRSERRQARQAVLQALYAHALGGGTVDHVRRVVLIPRLPQEPETDSFGLSLFDRVIEVEPETDKLVVEHTKNWALPRMALVDKLLMRMAVTEFLCFEDIPPKVSINEVLELAKEFSTEPSSQFINGILDSIVYSLRMQDKLRKSKEGMVGMGALQRQQDANRGKS